MAPPPDTGHGPRVGKPQLFSSLKPAEKDTSLNACGLAERGCPDLAVQPEERSVRGRHVEGYVESDITSRSAQVVEDLRAFGGE